MGLTERGVGVTDRVQAEMVECVPPPPPDPESVTKAPESSPTEKAADATIEQTGADPPPAGAD